MGGLLYPLSTIQLVVLTSLEASWGCPRPRPQMEHGINLSLGILCNDLFRRNFTWKKFASMLLCPTKQRNKTLLTSLVPNHSRRVRNTLEKGGQLSPASALCKECTAGQTQDEEQTGWAVGSHPPLPTSASQRRQYISVFVLGLLFFLTCSYTYISLAFPLSLCIFNHLEQGFTAHFLPLLPVVKFTHSHFPLFTCFLLSLFKYLNFFASTFLQFFS